MGAEAGARSSPESKQWVSSRNRSRASAPTARLSPTKAQLRLVQIKNPLAKPNIFHFPSMPDLVDLGLMINEFLDDDGPAPGGALFSVSQVEALVQDAAERGEAMSYSELLLLLGYRFTRPKMRALCKVLDEVDRRGAARGEPELAVLVVRESDRLPGQGWWVGRRDYKGEWTGPAAQAHIKKIQAKAFRHWNLAKRDS
jgi:hypothetical protein